MKIFQICLIIVLTSSLKVNLELPDLQNVTENTTYKDIEIRKGELFELRSSSLEDIPNTNPYCKEFKGMLAVKQKWQLQKEDLQYHEQFLLNKKYNILYRLNRRQLIAYNFDVDFVKIKELSRSKIGGECIKEFAFSHDEQYLYVFGCPEIYRISTKTILTSIQSIMELPENFNAHKLISVQDLFILVSMSSGIRIYGNNLNYNLTLIQEIKMWNGELVSFMPQDLVYRNGMLYVLNVQEFLFIYERVRMNNFEEKTLLSLKDVSEMAVNRRLKIWKNNIFIESLEGQQIYITEIQKKQLTYDLVRYYKSHFSIADWLISGKHLIVMFSRSINIYEINKDPRTIKHLLNGITSNHLQNGISLQPLIKNHYVLVTIQGIQFIELQIDYPKMICNFTSASSSSQQIRVQKPCKKLVNIRNFDYNFVCSRDEILRITIEEESQTHFWLVLIVLILSTVTILQLILWRKGKIIVIEALVDEINKLRKKNQDRIEFVEENYPPARQSNWEDIDEKQQKQLEEKEQKEDKEQEINENIVVATQMEMQ